jgi:hypothetical protein
MRADTTTLTESTSSLSYSGVATYRGISQGWVAVGGPRSKAATDRLLALVDRIRPDYSNRVITTLPL